jgi:RHS repeat-associated protein
MYSQAGQFIYDEDGRDQTKAYEYVYLNGSLVAKRSRDWTTNVYTTTYEHTDALHSPIVETDAGGNATRVQRYTPYGEPNSSYVQGPGFTGHVTDVATGLTYAQQRYYDPVIGRFLSVDSVAADPSSGGNFNRYWYGNNNPYRFTDPDGRRSTVESGRIKIDPEDKAVPPVSLPNNVGAKGVSFPSMWSHKYEVPTNTKLTNAKAVGDAFARNPTPGIDHKASPQGTVNNVGHLPYMLFDGGTNLVRSYLIRSPDTSRFTDIIVNYTIAGEHSMGEGFVMGFGAIHADKSITLMSYGEGNAFKQSMFLEGIWRAPVDKVWQENHQEIIRSASQ